MFATESQLLAIPDSAHVVCSGDDVFTEEVLAPSDGQGKSRKRTFEELGMEFTEVSLFLLTFICTARIIRRKLVICGTILCFYSYSSL